MRKFFSRCWSGQKTSFAAWTSKKRKGRTSRKEKSSKEKRQKLSRLLWIYAVTEKQSWYILLMKSFSCVFKYIYTWMKWHNSAQNISVFLSTYRLRTALWDRFIIVTKAVLGANLSVSTALQTDAGNNKLLSPPYSLCRAPKLAVGLLDAPGKTRRRYTWDGLTQIPVKNLYIQTHKLTEEKSPRYPRPSVLVLWG